MTFEKAKSSSRANLYQFSKNGGDNMDVGYGSLIVADANGRHVDNPTTNPNGGRMLYYPTLQGETGDPTIAGPALRVYFSIFPTGSFPGYPTSVFESVQLTLSTQTSLIMTSVKTNATAPSSATTSSVSMPNSPCSWASEIEMLVAAVAVVALASIFVLRRRGRKPSS